MRKIILDFYDVVEEMLPLNKGDKKEETEVFLADMPENRMQDYKELVHDYIARKMEFPDYYGKDLDSLYDFLTGICEPTAVGFFIPTVDFDDLSIDLMLYLDKDREEFEKAEADNPENLAVIMAESASAVPEEDPDDELDELIHGIMSGKRV